MMSGPRVLRWVLMSAGVGIIAYALADDLTLTTYYPSPRGVYKSLRTTSTTVLATQDGRVGIGTSNPDNTAMLDVAGTVKLSGSVPRRITNLTTPDASDTSDAATVGYVNAQAGGGGCFHRFCWAQSGLNGVPVSCTPPACPSGSVDQGFEDCVITGAVQVYGYIVYDVCTRACCK